MRAQRSKTGVVLIGVVVPACAFPRICGRSGPMRTMQIRPFPGAKMPMTDPGSLIKQRLIHDLVVWPDQAVPLVGYMAWPNDPIMFQRWLEAHRRDDASAISDLAQGLTLIEQHWARVADIVHLHYDLDEGRHLA